MLESAFSFDRDITRSPRSRSRYALFSRVPMGVHPSIRAGEGSGL